MAFQRESRVANEALSLSDEQVLQTQADCISLNTLVRFLWGSPSAILALASNRQTVWLGLLFVISAGFAREWDNHDLGHEPWHLLSPLPASLVTSFILFILVYVLALHRGAVFDRFWASYRSFLALYWMTAPLAWLYAIPVEIFLSANEAVLVNLALLAIVSVWRVVLIVRVIVVLFRARTETVLPLVLLFADSVVLFLFATLPQPVIEIMGGVRSQQTEITVKAVAVYAGIVGTLTYPLWLLCCLSAFSATEPEWTFAALHAKPRQPITPFVWIVAWSAIVFGVFLLAIGMIIGHQLDTISQK